MTPFVAPEALARRAGLKSLLRLGANESAFGPSPRALAAMAAELGRTAWYGDPESLDLREALAARHRCDVDEITVGAGIDDLLGLAVRTYCSPGSVAVMTRGSYPTFAFHVAGYGAALEAVPAGEAGAIDAAGLIAAARRTGAAILYVANPDNPSGSFTDAATIARLRSELPSATMIVLDEAYADFVDARSLPPPAVDAGVIRMRTFSKAYGMAGARIAYAIASREGTAAFQKVRLHFGVNRTAQIGALASLGDDAFVRHVVDEVARGRADYMRLAHAHGLRAHPSSTNFVCIEIGSRERADRMVDALLRLGVFVRKPGAPPIDGCIRVTVGTAAERERFAERFAEALASVSEKAAT